MAEGLRDERQSLGKFSSGQRKSYGSTETKQITNETYLKHHVKPHETLQGIALKYGTAMQQIKRANNMWTSDSLFLREYLLIPLPSSPRQDGAPLLNGSADANSPEMSGEIVTKLDLQMSRSSSKDQKLGTVEENAESDVTPKDFLNKFDSTLAQLRSSVQKLDETSHFPEDTSNPLNYLPRRGSSKYNARDRQRSQTDLLADANTYCEPDMVFKSKGTSRKIRSSLEQLEKTQDDMFQL